MHKNGRLMHDKQTTEFFHNVEVTRATLVGISIPFKPVILHFYLAGQHSTFGNDNQKQNAVCIYLVLKNTATFYLC